MSAVTQNKGHYYVPPPSPYPVMLSGAIFLIAMGAVLEANALKAGLWSLLLGALLLVYVLFHWFGNLIGESEGGVYHSWEDRSFRMGMVWFILSEIAFFAGLFGVLFYERNISVPRLAAIDPGFTLYPGFTAAWPTAGPLGKPFSTVQPWGIPALNTMILLTSGVTVTWAHWGLKTARRSAAIIGLAFTVALGLVFLGFQAREFYEAYTHLGLTLASGVYGATFFMLTGFHGLHVTVGVIMLSVILMRCIKGHFKPDQHFAFEAVSWYWHFVDVVWLLLFVFVYWL